MVGWWIGLAVALLLCALAWLGREIDLAAPRAQREPAIRQGQELQKEAKKPDPLPGAEDQKALFRLFLLVGLARGH
jgi:hypothetical protein